MANQNSTWNKYPNTDETDFFLLNRTVIISMSQQIHIQRDLI